MGCILIILGAAIYFARGAEDALILPGVGIILLAGGVIYPNRPRQEAATK